MRKSGKAALIAALVSSAMLTAPHDAAAQNAEIRVICSNGFRAAFEKLLPEAEKASARTAKVQFGPSRTLKQAMDGGEAFDVVIVTPQVIDELNKEGKVAPGTVITLASTGLGVAVRAGAPKPDVGNPQAIKQTLLAAKAVGYVQVGAGTPAILEMLRRLGIQDQVQSKTMLQTGADENMKNLAAGKFELALAPVSEILPASGVEFAGPIPEEFQSRVVMTAAIGSAAKDRQAAERFIHAFTGPGAARAIHAAGMEPAKK
jgi:molybdate transport system substrate-binding protein